MFKILSAIKENFKKFEIIILPRENNQIAYYLQIKKSKIFKFLNILSLNNMLVWVGYKLYLS